MEVEAALSMSAGAAHDALGRELAAATPLVSQSIVLLDRDHSLFAFNERVLDRAKRAEVPLLERLRYLCIVSSNLDAVGRRGWLV